MKLKIFWKVKVNIFKEINIPDDVLLSKFSWSGNADFYKTHKSAVFYSRETDSIATIAVGLYGALYGINSIAQDLKEHLNQANRRDFSKITKNFLKVIFLIMNKDLKR
jgi:ADP-ribosylglycohydrolase